MNRKGFAALIMAAFLTVGCGGNDNKVESKPQKDTAAAPLVKKEEQTLTQNSGKEEKAAADLCSCVNDALAGMNPKIRGIIIDAGKSENPELTLQKELLSAARTEEAQQLALEFEQFQQNDKLANCSAEIKRKYNLNEDDKTTRDKMTKAAAANGKCELLFALMRISEQQMAKENRLGSSR